MVLFLKNNLDMIRLLKKMEFITKIIYFSTYCFFQKNPENAIEAFKKGCELHNFSCCVNAMLMYKTGDGIPQDMELAKVYKKKAEDIRDHIQKDKDRISFQEGSETAGESGILGEQSYTL